MSEPVPCILCESPQTTPTLRIDTAELVLAYRWLSVDIQGELRGASSIELLRCASCHLEFFSPVLAGGADLYRQLQMHDWYYRAEKPELKYAAGFVRDSDRVLEIGAGRGAFAKQIASKEYVGLEFSPDAIAIAQRDGIDLRREPIETHAEAHQDHYDVVCTFQVLEHVSSPRLFLRSAVACIKPGGRLIIAVPNLDSYLRYAINPILNLPPHHVSWWSGASLSSVARLLGLEETDRCCHLLEDVHVREYLQTLVGRSLGERRLITSSWTAQPRQRLSALVARVIGPALLPAFRPIGQDISVVFTKPRE